MYWWSCFYLFCFLQSGISAVVVAAVVVEADEQTRGSNLFCPVEELLLALFKVKVIFRLLLLLSRRFV